MENNFLWYSIMCILHDTRTSNCFSGYWPCTKYVHREICRSCLIFTPLLTAVFPNSFSPKTVRMWNKSWQDLVVEIYLLCLLSSICEAVVIIKLAVTMGVWKMSCYAKSGYSTQLVPNILSATYLVSPSLDPIYSIEPRIAFLPFPTRFYVCLHPQYWDQSEDKTQLFYVTNWMPAKICNEIPRPFIT